MLMGSMLAPNSAVAPPFLRARAPMTCGLMPKVDIIEGRTPFVMQTYDVCRGDACGCMYHIGRCHQRGILALQTKDLSIRCFDRAARHSIRMMTMAPFLAFFCVVKKKSRRTLVGIGDYSSIVAALHDFPLITKVTYCSRKGSLSCECVCSFSPRRKKREKFQYKEGCCTAEGLVGTR